LSQLKSLKKGEKMTIQKILIPYNFTNIDQKAVEFAIEAFGHLQDIEITVFNAYTAPPEVETDASLVTGKLKSSLSYLSQKIIEQGTELDGVKQKLIIGGFAESKIETIFKPRKKDIASEIIQLALEKNFDVVVLNRKHAKVTRFFSGSVSHKIAMSLKSTTVCIVS
jgi:nucleotide-binding universal stress UspA family protein